MQQPEEAAPRDLVTVAKFSERYPAWTQASLRNLILNSQDRFNSRGERVVAGNGLREAIFRDRSRVLLSESRFFAWIAAQTKLGAARR